MAGQSVCMGVEENPNCHQKGHENGVARLYNPKNCFERHRHKLGCNGYERLFTKHHIIA